MIKRLFLILLLVLSGAAFADPPSKFQYRIASQTSSPYVDDPSALCASQTNTVNVYTLDSALAADGAYLRCKATRKSDGYVDYSSLSHRAVCADGSLANTSLPLAQQCPTQCPTGAVVKGTMDYGVQAPGDSWQKTVPLPNVFNGCKVMPTGVDKCYDLPSTGKTYCDYTMVNIGGVAGIGEGPVAGPSMDDGSGTAHPTTSPPISSGGKTVPCPKGSTEVGKDSAGTPICVGSGTTPSTTTKDTTTTLPPTTVTNADGSSTKTETTKVTNTDGSVTTTVKTTSTATDGTVSVGVKTSTGTTPTGAQGKPGTNGTNGADGKDAKGLCELHPELTSCRNSTASTDCTAGVSYTGDAIQGATLQTVNAMKCKQEQDDKDLKASPLYGLGAAASSGADPQAGTLPTSANATEVQVPSSLNSAGWVGAGSPFQDVTVTVQGRAITIPLAKWSGYLEAFKYVMMVIASLVSFKILSGAILRD